MWARFIAWGPGTTYAWTRFPSRPLSPAAAPALFTPAPKVVDLRQATGNANPDQFFTSSQTTALLVIQHDRLVLERYFNGATRSTMITAFSVTKSWASALVGAAIAAGYIHSLDDPVTRYIAELARKDPRFAAITLRDLLAMRSGLAWDTSGFLETDDSVVWSTPALRQAVLARVHIVAPPGRTVKYNDFNPLLLGIVLERATGRSVTQWLDQTLWGPLGAQYRGSFLIDSATGGFEKMESGLTGRPIDLIRLGVLYLHQGTWNGRQLIPRQWVAQSTDYARAGPSRFPGVRYGLGWWTRVIDGVQVFYAWGDHGEYILVAPSLDIVVARFGRQFGLGAPRGDSSGGSVGAQTWPRVLTRIATTVAATRT
jgi:CubicO group peptidase (beta-lactamase class C family)